MKKFAKLLAMVLAVSMVLTMFVGAYNDDAAIDEDKADAVKTVYEAGVMMGDTKGNFNPKDGLRRSEMAKILFALANYEQEAADFYSIYAATSFNDHNSIQKWAKAYIGYAADAKYIVGTTDGNANANGILCYADAAVMLLRTLGVVRDNYTVGEGEDAVTYNYLKGPKAYQNAILAAYQEGLFKLGDTTLDAADYRKEISREDVAVMIANAIKYAQDKGLKDADGNPLYKLATPAKGVITGTTTVKVDDVDVASFVITVGNETYTAPIGDLKVEDYLGRECSFVYEGTDKDDNPIVIGELVVDVDAKVIDTTVADIKFITDEKDLDADKAKDDKVITISDAYIASVEKVKAFYVFNNTLKTADITDAANVEEILGYEKANGNDNQAVKVVVNAESIAIFYAPYEIIVFDKDLVSEEYNSVKGEFTGKLMYDGEYYISEELAKIADNTIIAANVIDGEAFIVGYPTISKVTDLETAYSVKDGYTFTLNGEELDNATATTDATLFEGTLNADNKACIVVYNGKIVAILTPKEEKAGAYTFGFISDIEVDVANNADEDEDKADDKYIVTLTISATVNGTAATYTKEIKTDDITSAMPTFSDKKFYKFSSDAEGKFIGFEEINLGDKVIADSIDDKKVDSYEISKLYGCYFIDATEKGLTLANIEVKAVEGKSYSAVYVNGTRINKTDAVAYYTYSFDHDAKAETANVVYMVVVFDPASEPKFEVK